MDAGGPSKLSNLTTLIDSEVSFQCNEPLEWLKVSGRNERLLYLDIER